MTHRYTYHVDPGHGWLEVSLADVFNVGLTTSSFSEYSYAWMSSLNDAPSFYLEEDMDMATFIDAFMIKHGTQPALTVVNYPEDAPIRRFPNLSEVMA